MVKKAWIFGIVFLAAICVILGRLFWLALIDGESLSTMAREQQTSTFDYYQYARGDFIDVLGRNITGVEENCLVIFPAMMENTTDAAVVISTILSCPFEEVLWRLQAAIEQGNEPYILKTGLDAAQTECLTNSDVPGIAVLPLAARYSSSYLAVHLVGQVAQNGDDNNYHGISGLEAEYDQYLAGREDTLVAAYVDAEGQLTAGELFLLQQDISHGNTVCLTLNMDHQQIAMEAMGVYSGACVIMDPYNGDISACLSAPAYDPYGWEDLPADDVYVNKAVSIYPPASTFKIILAAAALETGILPLNEQGKTGNFVCDGAYTLAEDYDVACWKEDGHGEIGLEEALGESCNCYFIALGLALGGDVVKEYAARFGLNTQQMIGYDLPEYEHLDFSSHVEGDIANASIGEKGVRISPLQAAVMVSVCVNGGNLVMPRLVETVSAPDGSSLLEFATQLPRRSIASETAAKLKIMLVKTVADGTGINAAGEHITAGGKTGTSQDAGVWFCGFAPAEEPRWVIAVYVSDGNSGGAEAAEVFSNIVDRLAILEGIAY